LLLWAWGFPGPKDIYSENGYPVMPRYGLFMGKRMLRTHALTTIGDARHHIKDIKAVSPRIKLRIRRLR
jgi:hypothetical protein